MKKNLILILLSFLFFQTFSQNRMGMYFAPLLSQANNKFTQQSVVKSRPENISYGTGIFFEHDFKKNRYGPIGVKRIKNNGDTLYHHMSIKNKKGIAIGLAYQASNFSYILPSNLVATAGLKYIRTFTNGVFTFPVNDKWNSGIRAGLFMDYLLGTKGKTFAKGGQTDFSLVNNQKEFYNPFVLGTSLEVSLERKLKRGRIGNFYLARWVHLFIKAKMDYGLTSLTKRNSGISRQFYSVGVEEVKGTRLLSYGLATGFIYHFHRSGGPVTRY